MSESDDDFFCGIVYQEYGRNPHWHAAGRYGGHMFKTCCKGYVINPTGRMEVGPCGVFTPDEKRDLVKALLEHIKEDRDEEEP